MRRWGAFLDAGAVIASSAADGIHWEAEEHAARGRAAPERVGAVLGDGM